MATIQCSNPECKTINSLQNLVCEKCETPLLKRYLRPLGDWVKSLEVGQLIDERYLLINHQVILDAKPGIPPEFSEDIPEKIRKYLRLFPYRLHLPQIYTYYSPSTEDHGSEIALLEYGTIPLQESGEPCHPELLPPLTQIWTQTQDNPLRQLNWLWQITKLWQPLEGQQMVSSLLDTSLIRVNAGMVQLLDFRQDEHNFHNVKELGKLWLSLIEGSSPLIVDYLQSLCDYLQRGKIPHPDYLLTYFDSALTYCGQWYNKKYQIFTLTDSGPTRNHNEDACYPEAGELKELSPEEPNFTIVCDGVGGQDAGEVASQLAIDTLVEQIPQLPAFSQTRNSQQGLQDLAEAINFTNDRISERNDAENRHDRQRMGTTLVLSLVHDHEVYLANVGDSRIYLITPQSCHQVTTDDDLASREVRLGYLFYRDAIKYPNAGALVQALGMSNANSLHPNITRLITDDDCIFLLCSDGLSDYDRVDQYWPLEIAPILSHEKDLPTAGKELINVANDKNGHDNVTISLLYCQIELASVKQTPLLMGDVEAVLESVKEETQPITEPSDDLPSDLQPTEPFPYKEEITDGNKTNFLLIFSILGILVLILGLGIYGILKLLLPPSPPISLPSPSPSLTPRPSAESSSPQPGEFIQLTQVLSLSQTAQGTEPYLDLPVDTVLQILPSEDPEKAIKVKICQIASESSSEISSTKELEGKEVWMITPNSSSSTYQTYKGEVSGGCVKLAP
ncbi:PP2C family protein-serine/threonine phosphatase [Crocosphaera chwakensis]|nr:PP2C family serine/threonine-protein phosphatase [Crocosphaera chwakensis]